MIYIKSMFEYYIEVVFENFVATSHDSERGEVFGDGERWTEYLSSNNLSDLAKKLNDRLADCDYTDYSFGEFYYESAYAKVGLSDENINRLLA